MLRRTLALAGTQVLGKTAPRNDMESWTLADLRAGETARIACVECERAERCERLLAYGLIEGQLITLVQRAPAFVIRVEQTELALDEEVARCVKVKRDE